MEWWMKSWMHTDNVLEIRWVSVCRLREVTQLSSRGKDDGTRTMWTEQAATSFTRRWYPNQEIIRPSGSRSDGWVNLVRRRRAAIIRVQQQQQQPTTISTTTFRLQMIQRLELHELPLIRRKLYFHSIANWRYVALVVVLWRPALSLSWCEYRSWPWLETHKRNFWYVIVQCHRRHISDHLWMASTPCPEKNGTNNVLGITLANTNI